MAGARWTAHEIAKLRRLVDSGLDVPDIAKQFSCRTAHAVGCAVHQYTPYRMLRRARQQREEKRPWSAEDDALLLVLRRSQNPRFTRKQIAERLGRTPEAVHQHIQYMDVARAAQKHPGRQRRSCLHCRAPFVSEGPHNRMCDSCRGLSSGPYDI